MRSSFVVFSVLFFLTVASSIFQAEALSLGDFEHHEIPVPVVGPESLTFDCSGAVHVGVADGRIFKWLGSQYGWSEFATISPSRPRALCDGSTNKDNEPTCGRPLGLRFDHQTCELYIADAYFGLMKTGPNGGVARVLATSANGTPFKFTNDVDINPVTRMVYFTDSSKVYERRQWESSFSTGDRTGRLMRYHPDSGVVDLLMDNLAFPNGVAASLDGNFVLVTQTTSKNIMRYWVRGPRVGQSEVFATTQGFPDNIRRNINGEFWVAENSNGRGKVAKFDANGNFMEAIDGLNPVSHAQQFHGNLWIGSIVNPFVGIIRNIP
ncbi:protein STRICTOSIDINE SYNTHASE-LIKE 10-like [Argentina anserina]|uniref:protein STRICTOSIDINE SYNTHASE-LIKE 10-like n=1 Tax=Argentina anserina TaxID=57926 RepID=UPI002176815C|nr:protein STRICTOSIDINE SYNTHASE-LIKE 10-like [Potentilla anserina]